MTEALAPMDAVSIPDLIRSNEDQAFIKAAYLVLLGREVDPEGLENYTALLRTGMRKAAIVCVLATSDEGRQRLGQREPAGLAELLRAERARQHPTTIQRLWRRLIGPAAFDDALEMQRELRVAVNRNYLIERSLAQVQDELRLARTELGQLKEIVSAHGHQQGALSAAQAKAQGDEGVLHAVPPQAGRLLHAMRRYAAARSAKPTARTLPGI